MDHLTCGELTLYWLNGGGIRLDAGAMFGVVPKPLWSKRIAANEFNQIETRTDPIYFQLNGKHILIDAGLGFGKLTDKQKRNYGVDEESRIIESLDELQLKPEDIDIICMTHLHFDHASGLTKIEDNQYVSVFPNAMIYVSQIEWDEMRAPNLRSKNTYWEENWLPIKSQVQTFEESIQIEEKINMFHTGGHSAGHSIILLHTEAGTVIHLADLLPTIAHKPSLWVTAYDDYPLDSIHAKEKWIHPSISQNSWFIFYHDDIYRAVKWDSEGKVVSELKRSK